jgi:hypothetical protein
MSSTERIERRPSVAEVRTTVCTFLEGVLSDVQRVNIVGFTSIDADQGVWEVEAEVWQPNATIAALGLPVQHVVLDRNCYVVRLDAGLNVLAYGTKQSE